MKKHNNVLNYLQKKNESDNFIRLDEITLKKQNKSAKILEKRITKFIEKRIHPKSGTRLIQMLKEYEIELIGCMNIEKEIAYQNGFSDAMKFIISTLNHQLE